MNRDKKILYSISIFLFVMLSLVFFIPTNSTKIIVAALLIAYAIILNLLVKKKETKSIHSRQVLLLMSVIGLVYVMLYYLTGLHFGFYKASPPLSFKSVTNVIIPVVIVFFTSEFIADRLLDQHNKFVEVLVFLSLILIDISMFSSLSNIKTFNQFMVSNLSEHSHLIILCGHYEGVDQRVIDELIDEEISIGDYVLTGGEIPAMVIVDSVSRFLPNVLHSGDSVIDESFMNNTLEYPQYTRPADFNGLKVPDVLLSGNHAEIAKWRKLESERITKERRPDLLKNRKNN